MRRALNNGARGAAGANGNNFFYDDSSEDEAFNEMMPAAANNPEPGQVIYQRNGANVFRPIAAHHRRMLPALPAENGARHNPHPVGNNQVPFGQLVISWMSNLGHVGFPDSVAISELPGLCYRDYHRSLTRDIETIKRADITDVVCLLAQNEFVKFRVPNLLEEYEEEGLVVYHFPIEDGMVPEDVYGLNQLLVKIRKRIADGNRVLVHCFGGMGRAVLVGACLTLTMDKDCTPTEVIDQMRALRGPRAVQSVKQYNFINEFRELSVSACVQPSSEIGDERCVSR